MLTFTQAIILGLAQGITELFPISSLGHTILLPGLLGWHIDQNAESFLMFLVGTHFATALVLLFIYRRDWWLIVKGVVRSLREREIKNSDVHAKLGWLLIVSTIPAGILGLLFKDQITGLLLTPRSAAIFLTLNGVLLFIAERFRRHAVTAEENVNGNDERIAHKLSWWQAAKVGIMQVLALFPGFSRTGSTLAGSLMVGLTHEEALRYSFLLATPIIFAAAALELPGLFAPGNGPLAGVIIVGAIAAAIAAYGAITFLTRHFKTRTLTPFAVYCVLAGILSLLFLR